MSNDECKLKKRGKKKQLPQCDDNIKNIIICHVIPWDDGESIVTPQMDIPLFGFGFLIWCCTDAS